MNMRLHMIILLGGILGIMAPSCSFKSAIDADGNISSYEPSGIMRAYGNRSFKRVKKKKPLSENVDYHKALNRVVSRLKKVIPMSDTDWEFVIFNESSANAFALPGGKVGVYSGLFKLIKDDDLERSDALLAAVLGHEIAHATSQHAEYKMFRGLTLLALSSALWYGLDQHGEDHSEYAFAAFTLGAHLSHSLPLSRWQEYESDRVGAVYMAKAGYDPRESIELWRRLEYHHFIAGKPKPTFFRTHPPDLARIEHLENFMSVALKFYQPKKRME